VEGRQAQNELELFVKQLCSHFLFDALNPTLKPGLGAIM
jgi:LytS/YehU family sensor histidine kinase